MFSDLVIRILPCYKLTHTKKGSSSCSAIDSMPTTIAVGTVTIPMFYCYSRGEKKKKEPPPLSKKKRKKKTGII